MGDRWSVDWQQKRSLSSSTTSGKRKRGHRRRPPHSTHAKKEERKRKLESLETQVVQTSNLLNLKVEDPPCTSISTDFSHHKRRRNTNFRQDVNNRRWVFSSHDSSRFKDKVIVVSYNILGVENASKHLDLYENIKWKHLDWDWRKLLIRKELNQYNPGILCFQEVDRFSDLADVLKQDGFEGVYKARTGEACDGCAMFWKKEQFSLLHQDNIEFRKFDMRDNVAQFCVLKMNSSHSDEDVNSNLPLATPRTFLVGNIHVLFNPNRGDVKLGQIRLFVEKAQAISQEWGSIPIILAGDLNSMPQSAAYQFLASSELEILHHDRRRISGQIESLSRWQTVRCESVNSNRSQMTISRSLEYEWSSEELEIAAGNSRSTRLQHQLNLSSAYVGVRGAANTRDGCGEPLATSYHSKFLGTVDYIWHSKELVPLSVLETLPVHILRQTGGLPSEKWGSDHLALVCELAFEDNGDGS